MNNANALNIKALQQYTRLGTQTEVDSASQHRLIQMLMEGALARIIKAKTYIRNNDIQQKGEFIGMAISIIGGLRDSLDHNAGKELAMNLDKLYEYMSRRLMEANIKNSVPILDEVYGLLVEIKSAWDTIGQQALSSAAMNAKNANMTHAQAV